MRMLLACGAGRAAPLLAVQLMGVAYRMKMSRVEKRAAPAFDGRDEIVELEEEWA